MHSPYCPAAFGVMFTGPFSHTCGTGFPSLTRYSTLGDISSIGRCDQVPPYQKLSPHGFPLSRVFHWQLACLVRPASDCGRQPLCCGLPGSWRTSDPWRPFTCRLVLTNSCSCATGSDAGWLHCSATLRSLGVLDGRVQGQRWHEACRHASRVLHHSPHRRAAPCPAPIRGSSTACQAASKSVLAVPACRTAEPAQDAGEGAVEGGG